MQEQHIYCTVGGFVRKFIQIIGLICFVVFGFFYTDKVMEVIREEDDIMIQLSDIKDILKVEPVDAKITSNTMIPGLNGKSVNIDKSYKVMKSMGVFNQNEIIFDVIHPNISMINNKDKYLIKGNNNKQMVSLILLLDSNKYLDKIEKIVDSKGITVNYFINYGYLISNSTKIKDMINQEFYSYGENGTYTPDNLLFSNNLISRISNNNANLCLAIDKEKNILELCSKNDLYTITPNIIVEEHPYDTVKNNLTSGSMILLKMNNETIKELNTIIDYIKGKGLKIDGLSKLLNEELE